jgi:biotin-dependent carboxylase-like uncharacterized protein
MIDDQEPVAPGNDRSRTDSSLRIIEPGLLTTIQDLGRPGFMRFGVTPGGALDRTALILGNRLVANDPGAAALEITLIGPRLRFSSAAVISLTGADLGARHNGGRLPLWQPIAVNAGDEISFDPSSVPPVGARAYLCLAGGILVAPVMGSRSTDLFGGIGGWNGRALRAGDAVPLPSTPLCADDILRRRLGTSLPVDDPDKPIRVVLGPQEHRFPAEAIALFLTSSYTMTATSDRMGLRLSGPAIAQTAGADPISEGIAHGAIQIPGDGQPIILLAGRQTIGGYPKLATVIGADLDRLGQRRPGDVLRFASVDLATAARLGAEYRDVLGEGAIAVEPRRVPGWSASGTSDSSAPTANNDSLMLGPWTPDAIALLAASLRRAGATSFRMEIPGSLNLELTFERPGAPEETSAAPASPASPSRTAAPDPRDLVVAPVLGVFYRRSAPTNPALAEEGQIVDHGQPLGVIEVMKTYHEVTSPRSGLLATFLVADGQSVEYGQPIARLAPSGVDNDDRPR